MEKKTLKIVNKSPNPNPCYAKKGDSGFDLRAWLKESEDGVFKGEDGLLHVYLTSLERRLIHTGIYVQLPAGTELQIRTRSGCALKMALVVCNTPGTIDEFYSGEICIIAINLSNKIIDITSGDRIAQAVLMPVFNEPLVNLEMVETIEDNDKRGSDGFGSSGVK